MKLTRSLAILAVLATSACGKSYETEVSCRQQAGPQPYAGATAFGAIGAVVMISQPEWQNWNHRRAECVRTKMAKSSG